MFGAWVEAGVLGAAFWLWVLWLAGRALLNGRFGSTHLAPLVTFAGLMLLWDVLFSPFGAERRFITPFYIALLMSVLRRPGVDRLGK